MQKQNTQQVQTCSSAFAHQPCEVIATDKAIKGMYILSTGKADKQ
jgi:hypothetical protein